MAVLFGELSSALGHLVQVTVSVNFPAAPL
jgi:hypothetical protein